MIKTLTPKEVVQELDRFIISQEQAKRAVAIALRNRWRRLQVSSPLKEEILPKNILMVGPTGVGKTEIARRVAKLDNAPFIKVEATKFTEIGYVGRDVEQIIRDLVDTSILLVKNEWNELNTKKAMDLALDKVVDILVGEGASSETRAHYKDKVLNHELDDSPITIDIKESQNSPDFPMFDVPGSNGAQMGILNIGELMGKAFQGDSTKPHETTVKNALKLLKDDLTETLIDKELLKEEALRRVEENGIVFLDEIDKICDNNDHRSGTVSREGVQRDLLPLIEGTIVPTKYGQVKTDHILFIASGAFHLSKPSDLLPELQGRLPIRVELSPLKKEDFVKILSKKEYNLLEQQTALLKTDAVELSFTKDAIECISEMAETMNDQVENIGARRLHTILERVIEDISFESPLDSLKKYEVTSELVEEKMALFIQKPNLANYIL